MRLERHSSVSTRGYIHVLTSSNGSTPKPAIDPVHIVIYPSVDHRIVPIPLAESGVKQGDKLLVVYSKEIDSISPEMARYELQL